MTLHFGILFLVLRPAPQDPSMLGLANRFLQVELPLNPVYALFSHTNACKYSFVV